MPLIPGLGRLRLQAFEEFKASLGYIVRPCLKKSTLWVCIHLWRPGNYPIPGFPGFNFGAQATWEVISREYPSAGARLT
jgi:hypothetical protein